MLKDKKGQKEADVSSKEMFMGLRAKSSRARSETKLLSFWQQATMNKDKGKGYEKGMRIQGTCHLTNNIKGREASHPGNRRKRTNKWKRQRGWGTGLEKKTTFFWPQNSGGTVSKENKPELEGGVGKLIHLAGTEPTRGGKKRGGVHQLWGYIP